MLLIIALMSCAWTLPAQGQDKATKSPSPFVGYFEDNAISITVRETGGKLAGEIKRDGKSFDFTGNANETNLEGEFELNGKKTPFTAKLTDAGLNLDIGFQAYKLRRTYDASAFVGTFRATGLYVELQRNGSKFNGRLHKGENAMSMQADLIGQSLKGTLVDGTKVAEFTATVEGDVLSFNTGKQPLKLNRVIGLATGDSLFAKVVTKEVSLFEAIGTVDTTVVVGPFSRRVALVTFNKGKRTSIIDGVAQTHKYDPLRHIFSLDGKHVATLFQQGDTWAVNANGKTFGPYDNIGRGNQFFNADAKQFAFAFQAGGKWRVNHNGTVGEPYDEIRGITFSEDGSRFSYIGRRGFEWVIVIDGKAGATLEGVAFGQVMFSFDGKRAAYVNSVGTQYTVVVDGVVSPRYDNVTAMLFSDSNDRFGFIARQGAKYMAVIDGKQSKAYDHVKDLAFSPDGKHSAFVARREGKSLLVIDGKKEAKAYANAFSPVFSAGDGKLAYIASDAKGMFVVHRGQREPSYQHIRKLTFSPNGKRLVYEAKNKQGRWYGVVDGHRSNPYDAPPAQFRFSKNGRHYAFFAERGGEHFLSINGKDTKSLPAPLRGSRPIFDGPDRLHTLIRRGDQFLRFEVEIEG